MNRTISYPHRVFLQERGKGCRRAQPCVCGRPSLLPHRRSNQRAPFFFWVRLGLHDMLLTEFYGPTYYKSPVTHHCLAMNASPSQRVNCVIKGREAGRVDKIICLESPRPQRCGRPRSVSQSAAPRMPQKFLTVRRCLAVRSAADAPEESHSLQCCGRFRRVSQSAALRTPQKCFTASSAADGAEQCHSPQLCGCKVSGACEKLTVRFLLKLGCLTRG
jgi:hypothetical protein